MTTKIFQQGFNSKKSSNTSSGLNVQFNGKRKLLPLNDVADVISQYDQYRDERENCNTIRLTCQVNPICTNVLFNKITEIVKDEGSSAVTFINYSIDSTDEQCFNGVVYKPKTIDFWSSGNMSYQGSDPDIDNLSLSTTISEAINNTEIKSTAILEKGNNAIRDTQLSNTNINFVYHCGLDIFNNHLIRSKTFKTVCKMPPYNIDDNGYGAFNTIADLMRDVNGKKVVEKITYPIDAHVNSDNAKFATLHLYEYDDILSFQDCKKEKLISKFNGWVGFNNTSKIKSYDNFRKGDELKIERPIMNMNAGDFVDMYPDRSLYSFVPKFNDYQKRIEKNWNYCITYPSSSYTPSSSNGPFSDIIEYNNNINSLKTIYFDENTIADNGTKQLVMYSISKHGLQKGDYVNIYKTYYDDESKSDVTIKIIDNAEISEVVDDWIFTVFNSNIQISDKWIDLDYVEHEENKLTIDDKTYDLDSSQKFYKYIDKDNVIKKYYIINNQYVNLDDTAQRISYKKVVNDIECDYYIRIFSKLPNFKFASGDTSNEYEIYRERNEHGIKYTYLDKYKGREYDFENHISRLAFAKNVYNDEVGELIFTDDIDISNIHDNLGRPLTSLYLTFIKNNKGYKEWYGDEPTNNLNWDENDMNTYYKNVEYSHCFGPVTCGIEASIESMYNNDIVNVRMINSIDYDFGYKCEYINSGRTYDNEYGNNKYDIRENEVWYDTDVNFYGDLCYYDNYNAIERHIQYIMHRVNTAQRESSNLKSSEYYNSLYYDEIIHDDYDTNYDYEIDVRESEDANKFKEGYYYIPHYEVPIKTFDKLQSVMPDFLTIRSIKQIDEENKYVIHTLENHYLSIGDKCVLYDSEQEVYYNLIAVNGDYNNFKVFTCNAYSEESGEPIQLIKENMLTTYKLFKMDNLDVPSYARILKDGTCRIIWRNVLNNGFNESDDSVEEYPFTNGAFYINKKVDIYMRRQDPYNEWGLYREGDVDGDIEGNEIDISNEDNYIKEEDIEC